MRLTPFMAVIDLQFLSLLFFHFIWIHSPTDFNSNILLQGPWYHCSDHSSHLLSSPHITVSSPSAIQQSGQLFNSAVPTFPCNSWFYLAFRKHKSGHAYILLAKSQGLLWSLPPAHLTYSAHSTNKIPSIGSSPKLSYVPYSLGLSHSRENFTQRWAQ